jgi:WD40 repeat protein
VQVFDPASGEELRTVETPRGYRGSLNYLQLAKDGRTLFVALDKSTFEPVRDGEKKSFFRRYHGETRVYDLGTGEVRAVLRAEPPRGVMSLAVSPDGAKVATMEYTSGRTEDFDNLRAIYLWDVAARTAVKLRDGYGGVQFSPDGGTVYVTVDGRDNKGGVVYAYAAATGREVARQESRDGPWSALAFSADGKLAAARMPDPDTNRPGVRLLGAAKLENRGALAAGPEAEGGFGHMTFSPDGRRLAATAKGAVYLWDVEARKLVGSWRLDTPGRVWSLAFDPSGRRLAASTWFVPPELQGARDEAVTPQDFPQPKVFLLREGTAEPETLVCPHGYWGRLAFSPDGSLLAVGGAGTTHLFDVRAK